MQPLTPIEARVLATLMEKARTVPDSYPLSVNALALGCNQKTSRDPVMELAEQDVLDAIASLRSRSLVFEASASRVARFEHNFQRGYSVSEPQAVLLGLLMLRGPQTPGELRSNADRWYKFADIAAVEDMLAALQARGDDGGAPFVRQLARAGGMREQRWAHLLCGDAGLPALPDLAAAPGRQDDEPVSIGQAERLQQRIALLESQVAHLQARLAHVLRELGLSQG